MTKIEKPQPLGQHFGRVPTDRRVLVEMRRSHSRGFNTMLMADYEELARVGLGPDQMITVLQAAPREALELPPVESLV